MPEQRFDATIQPLDAHFQIDADFGDKICWRQNRSRYFIEARCEVGDLVAGDGDSGGSTVPAVAKQVLARLTKCAVEIELGNRSAGTFPLLARQRDQHRRTSKFLDEARGDDPDNARMPRVVGEDDGVLFVEIHRQHLLTRFLESRVIDLLAAVIQLLELASDHVRFVLALRE